MSADEKSVCSTCSATRSSDFDTETSAPCGTGEDGAPPKIRDGQGKLTPFGIFLPDQRELNFYFTSSKVTSDFIVDRLRTVVAGESRTLSPDTQVIA